MKTNKEEYRSSSEFLPAKLPFLLKFQLQFAIHLHNVHTCTCSLQQKTVKVIINQRRQEL